MEEGAVSGGWVFRRRLRRKGLPRAKATSFISAGKSDTLEV